MSSSKQSLFAPLKKAVLAFFQHDLAVRRGEGRVRLVLEDRVREPKPRPPSKIERAVLKDARELTLAREELARVLDEGPALRSTLRHLAFVEHALEKKAWRGLYKVPLEVLQKALAQLEDLVTNWSPEGLASLRSKMAVAVIDREHNNAEADAYRTAAMLDGAPTLAAQAIEAAMAPSADDEDAALLAAYAAMGVAPPGAEAEPAAVELQGELGSRSARDLARQPPRHPAAPPDIHLRDLPA